MATESDVTIIMDTMTPTQQQQQNHHSLILIPEGINIVNFWGNAKSAVWKYFGFLADDSGCIIDRTRAVCRLCRFAIRFSGNTTNLGNHMHKHHPDMDCTLDSKVPQGAYSKYNGGEGVFGIYLDTNNNAKIYS